MRLRALFTESDRTVLAVTATAALCLALYMNQGHPRFAAGVLGTPPDAPGAVVWQFLASLLLFGLVPCLVYRGLLGLPLRDLGIGAGDRGYGLRFTAVVVPLLVVPAMLLAARLPDVRTEYPLARGIGSALGPFLLFEAAYLLYYVGWEIFFRGFLVLGLERRIGALPAVALSTLVSTAVHYGKPEGEVWGAVVVGVIFGWLAIRTRSVLYPFLLHAAVGILTDVFIVLGPGSLR